MKKLFLLLLLLVSLNNFAQQDYTFGEITSKELEMKVYEKDSTANAVVLYEEGNTEFIEKNNHIFIQTVIYKKIKIFNKEGADFADISIRLYNNKSLKETVKKIRGVTHNLGANNNLNKKNIFTNRLDEKHSEVVFTLPNIQDGSVIEYTYTLESPFTYLFTGWNFQSSIPKVESVFKAKIPGNYVYNRELHGYLKLDKNESTVKKHCFKVEGIENYADCEVLNYSMKDIPAFIEEDYMTSKWNYLSRISFELSELHWFDGTKKKYTKTWKSVDNEFKSDKEIGGQLRRKSFFKNKIPDSIINITDVLERAKKTYTFIQNHFTWNGKYRMFRDISVTGAFNKKQGTVSEINLSLINALKVAGIDTQLTLLSTRNNGFPTKRHPVISDFNYIIAKITIGEKTYFLDATDKNLPFGVLPYRCLNNEARVMDFKNGSYWTPIVPIKNSGRKIQMLLELNDDGNFEGNMRIISNGYTAIDKRKELHATTEDKYIENYEVENDFLEIESYKNTNLNAPEKPLKEEYKITIENDNTVANTVYLNPFFIDKIEENPFKLKTRIYPVNFGYPRKFEYLASIIVPPNYSVESLPKSKIVRLPDNDGYFVYKITNLKNKIMVNFSFVINKIQFNSDKYLYLKEFFKQAIIAQNEPIILKKN